MENTGQLYAYDADRMRLRPIFERLKRAGVRNAQVLDPGDAEALAGLEGKMDRVVVDAPLHRLRRLAQAPRRQMAALAADAGGTACRAARRARPGRAAGEAWRQARLYHLLGAAAENRDQVEAFLSRFPQYSIVPWPDLWSAASLSAAPPQSADGSGKTLLMTPRTFGTDGFFVAVLERK